MRRPAWRARQTVPLPRGAAPSQTAGAIQSFTGLSATLVQSRATGAHWAQSAGRMDFGAPSRTTPRRARQRTVLEWASLERGRGRGRAVQAHTSFFLAQMAFQSRCQATTIRSACSAGGDTIFCVRTRTSARPARLGWCATVPLLSPLTWMDPSGRRRGESCGSRLALQDTPSTASVPTGCLTPLCSSASM